MESHTEEIMMHEIDASAFEEILKYAYIGSLPKLIDANVYSLLVTSEFLGVEEVESDCLGYIERNVLSLGNIIEIFNFACAMNKIHLRSRLRTYIKENLQVFCENDELGLLKISFDELKIQLEQLYFIPLRRCDLRLTDEDFLLNGLMRWVYHSRNDRAKHFEELSACIDFEKISTACLVFLSKEFDFKCDDKISLKTCLMDLMNRITTNVCDSSAIPYLSLIHISEPTRPY